MLSIAPQVISANPVPLIYHTLAPSPLSAAALAEAEAAHTAQGRRLYEARLAKEQWAAEMAQKAAEQAREQVRETKRQAAEQTRLEAEKAQEMQAHLQQ